MALWVSLQKIIRRYHGLSIILTAALLLELTVGIMLITTQQIIQETMERLVEREMYGIFLSIRNQLSKFEVTVDNMSWVVKDDLDQPDNMYTNTRRLVENNPSILGSSITFIPNYYPQKGYWFEPYAVRRADGTIESMQLGSAQHDYTNSEFFTVPISQDRSHWSEPYMDPDGAKTMVTTYGVPVHDSQNKVVAIVDADLSLDWLKDVINENMVYETTQRFLMTGKHHLLAGQDGQMFKMVAMQLLNHSEEEGYFTFNAEEGNKLHVFFHPIGGMTDWVLACVVDDSEVFGRLRHLQYFLFFVIIAGLLLLGLIIYGTSRNLERLNKANAEKERISSELRVASQIQQGMLPKSHLLEDGVEVSGLLKPAREVGGDLFDYFIRNEKLFFFIGDVCGKGVPAAMFMARVHSMLHAFSLHHSNPAHIVQAVNEAVCQKNDASLFVTLFVGVLDLQTGCLHYCNAGHNVPYILDKELITLDNDPNLPIGPFDDAEFNLEVTMLNPGSTIFLYTDGLTEADDKDSQKFGRFRIEDVLKVCIERQLNPEGIIDSVTEEVRRYVKESEQSDDLTMLAIQRLIVT